MQPDKSREDRVVFQPIDIDRDVPDFQRWLADPDVAPWYEERDLEATTLREVFGPEVTTHKFLIVIDGVRAGYLQAYRLSDEPEYHAQLGLDRDAGSIDLFIGEPQFRNAGWGAHILRAALERIVFGEMGCDLAMIAPDPTNARAVRSYEQAGYRQSHVVTIEDEESPWNSGEELVMLLERDAFMGGR